MLNVLYISHYPDLKMGGQQSMYALINNLDRSRIKPFAIVPSKGELYDRLIEIDCATFVVPLTSLKPKHLWQIISNIRIIHKIINDFRIDIVHPDHERDSIVAGLSKIFTKASMIWHVRLTRPVSSDSLSVLLADGIIGIADDVGNRFKSTNSFAKKYRTIYNGVNTDIFCPVEDKYQVRGELLIETSKFIVTFVGQFKEGKGVIDLILSAQYLKPYFNEIQILLIGTPENSEFSAKMSELIDSNKLDDLIKILPQQNNIYKYMQASDVLILPSHEGTEGMGRVLFEAMSCGVPVIGTNVKGVREAISTDTGLLIEEKNPEEISLAIKEFLLNIDFRNKCGIEARKRALDVFDIKHHAQKVMEFYNFILDN